MKKYLSSVLIMLCILLSAVVASAEKAEWKNLSDIKVDFLSADYVGNQHYVFNIRGNNYRLVVVVKFTIGYLFIRWIGTHKEYDKIDCSTI